MALFMEVLGVPPTEMIDQGCRAKKFFNEYSPKIKPNKKGRVRKPGTKKLKDLVSTEDENFLDFLKKALEWNPSERLTPSEALMHPWIINGLP